jgi:CubicO group peptidase (beta-lactamase class C family)
MRRGSCNAGVFLLKWRKRFKEEIMFSELTAFLDSFVRDGAPGYDLAVLQHGREIFRHQSGYTNVEKQIPVAGNERYNLYSCSKPITVTAALMLYEEGLYRLDDPLYAILPNFVR